MILSSFVIFSLALFPARACITEPRTFDMKIDVFDNTAMPSKQIGSYYSIINPLPQNVGWNVGNSWELFNELCYELPPGAQGFYGIVSNFSAAPRIENDASPLLSINRFVNFSTHFPIALVNSNIFPIECRSL